MFLPEPLAWSIIGIVTTIWSTSQLASIFISSYTTDPMLHTIFMAVVGSAFLAKKQDHNPGKNGSSNE